MKLRKSENVCTRGRTCSIATSSTTNPTWIDVGPNQSLSVVTGRRIPAWSTARPTINEKEKPYPSLPSLACTANHRVQVLSFSNPRTKHYIHEDLLQYRWTSCVFQGVQGRPHKAYPTFLQISCLTNPAYLTLYLGKFALRPRGLKQFISRDMVLGSCEYGRRIDPEFILAVSPYPKPAARKA